MERGRCPGPGGGGGGWGCWRGAAKPASCVDATLPWPRAAATLTASWGTRGGSREMGEGGCLESDQRGVTLIRRSGRVHRRP